MTEIFEAVVVRKDSPKEFSFSLEELTQAFLPKGEVLVRVEFTSINYKDLMSCSGNPAVTRRYPHIPGLDAAGVIEQSESPLFAPGQRVLIVSTPMGMNHMGGFSQYIRVPAAWLTPIPESLTCEEAMAYGTAGYTSALSVAALEKNALPYGSEVVVTGATGGVGCVSIAMLAALGYSVTAVSRGMEHEDFLKSIGADKVMTVKDLLSERDQNLLQSMWQAAIDTLGGEVLSRVLKKLHHGGILVSTGLALDTHFQANVLPFILRGASILGINAEGVIGEEKEAIWQKMAGEWKPNNLKDLYQVVQLQELTKLLKDIPNNKPAGRIVVDMRGEHDA